MPANPWPGWGPDNPFWDAFESDPRGQRANYFSFQDRFGAAPNRRKFFEGQFQDTIDRYTGHIAGQLKSGQQNPTTSLSSFLEDYFAEGGGAQQQWQGMSPRARGQEDSRFAPQARWMVNSGPQF